jgi:hypothetical protein
VTFLKTIFSEVVADWLAIGIVVFGIVFGYGLDQGAQ